MNWRLVGSALVGVLMLAGVAAAVAFGLTAGSSERELAPLESGDPITVATGLSPPVHRLGDRVAAQLELTVDTRLVDPGSVEVAAQFAPYELARDVEISRSDAGTFAALRYTYRLQCLVSDCVGEQSTTVIELARAQVSYVRTDTNRALELQAQWPTATVVARAGAGAAAVPAEAMLDRLPDTTYAIPSGLLRGLAIGLATLLLLAVSVWAFLVLRPRVGVQATASELPAQSDSLRAALVHLVEARSVSTDQQRLALELLARELELVNGQELAPLARQLAWSAGALDPIELDGLLVAAEELERAS